MTRADSGWGRTLRAIERLFMVIAMPALGWSVGMRLRQCSIRALLRASSNDYANMERPNGRVWLPRPTQGDRPVRRWFRRKRDTLLRRTRPDPACWVPRIGLEAMVREGTDARTLRRAVGHMSHTALPGAGGNVVLAAHRDTFFRPLKNVRRGDRIDVTTADGTFTYVVRDTRVVAPTDVSVGGTTPDDALTLVTCYPFTYIGKAAKRFIVRAEKTQNSELRTQNTEAKNILNSGFRNSEF